MISQAHFDRILSSLNLSSGSSVLLAVSGGVDSMVMACLFSHSAIKCRLAIAHCNFHLRGADSDSDEALVREYAGMQGIVFKKKDFCTKEYAASNGSSIEMAARELRYSWFEEVCQRDGYVAVAVAHNQNDNAETLILNMLRGCGIGGATGMRLSSKVPVKGAGTVLLRPMLGFSRKDIYEYAVSQGIKWHEDKTNADSAYKRNLIRNEIFPLFEKLNPAFLSTLSKDMANYAQAQRAADEWSDRIKEYSVTKRTDGGIAIGISKLREHPAWEYFIFSFLTERGFGAAVIEDLVKRLHSGGNIAGKHFFSSEYSLSVSSNELIISHKHSGEPLGAFLIPCPGEYEIAGRKFSVVVTAYSENMPLRQPEGTVALDAGKIGFPLKVRSWREGDWMCPLGVRTQFGGLGRKKLQDIFTDLKFSIADKANALLLQFPDSENASHVAAILCSRIDETVKITPETCEIIRISEAY
ncbi:MAG: tRNA lysidine(34) synthetase TilS [Bacteroidales bacterium]|nr:tRNA lysidine(34) synthetase TilS [Bacteroidales bacterium]MDY2935005.1 tRNA lysidine(34) synthetase TilS [Candidatus Cryptobacteroides sp.]